MVFVIPENIDNAAGATQGVQGFFGFQNQQSQSSELGKALGIGSDINMANLSPEQQKLVIANEQAKKKQLADQQLMNFLMTGQAPQQQTQPSLTPLTQENQQLPQAEGGVLNQIAGALGLGSPTPPIPNAPQEQNLVQLLDQAQQLSQPPVQSQLQPQQQPIQQQVQQQPAQQQPQISQSQATSSAALRNNERGQQRPRLTDSQVSGLSIKHPKVAQIVQSQNRADDARLNAKAARNWDIAKKVFQDSDKAAQGLITKENALAVQRNAIAERGTGGFTQDMFANFFGSDLLRTAEGAGFITAGKEFLLGNIKRAGTRPNQWIEQQISKALPKLGQTDAANNTVIEMLDLENRIQRKEIELIDEIADKQEREVGYVKRSLGAEVQKELKKFADQELKITEKRMRDIASADKPEKREAKRPLPEGRVRIKLSDGRTAHIQNTPEAIEQARQQFGDLEVVK